MRAEENGKQLWAALHISHGAVTVLFFLFMLVVTVFTQVGGPVNQAGQVTVEESTGIGVFHVGNDTECMNTSHEAQTALNQTTKFILDHIFTVQMTICSPRLQRQGFCGHFGKHSQIDLDP